MAWNGSKGASAPKRACDSSFADKLATLFTVVCLCLGLYGISSGNVVGYQKQQINRGVNTIILPKPLNMQSDQITGLEAIDILGNDALLEGDEILLCDGIGNEEWCELVADDSGLLYPFSSSGEDLSNWLVPMVGGESLLRIRRNESEGTEVALAGEYDIECPVNLSTYVSNVKLSDIKLDKDGSGISSKLFDVIAKDGSVIAARVDPDSRYIVDAKTGKPISLDISDVKTFSPHNDAKIAEDDKMQPTEIVKMTKDVARVSRSREVLRAVRDGIVGNAWDSKNPYFSVFVGIVIIGVLTFVQWLWGVVGRFSLRMILIVLKKVRCVFMKDNKQSLWIVVWICLVVIGLSLVAASCVLFEPLSWVGQWREILRSIGLSIVASVVCGLMVDCAQKRNQTARARRYKTAYFSDLNRELRMLMGNLLWYVDRLQDASFNWNESPESYWKKSRLISLQDGISKHEIAPLDLEEVVSKLKVRFSCDSVSKLSQHDYAKIVALFDIVMYAAVDLKKCLVDLHQQRLVLAYEDVYPLNESDKLIKQISMTYELCSMAKQYPRFNYGLIIDSIAKALKMVESQSKTASPLQVTLTCPCSII